MEEIVRFLTSHHRFLVVSHSRPDGDALGSALGLALALRSQRKTAHVVSADPHPSAYNSLPGIDSVQVGGPIEGNFEGLIVLECNDLARTGIEGLSDYLCLNIDHHPKNAQFGNLNWVDPEAAAVGEMIFRLIQALQIPLSAEIATNLYVAILTDTGSFQFSNTGAQTFQIAAQLVEAGANPGNIARFVYMNQPESRLRLLAELLHTLQIHPEGRISWIHLDQEMLKRTGAAPRDTEGLVNYPLSIEGVQACAFFREESPHSYRVSLRSKGRLNVGSVAESFGGGGHNNASGLSLAGNFREVREIVIGRLVELLQQHRDSDDAWPGF